MSEQEVKGLGIVEPKSIVVAPEGLRLDSGVSIGQLP
jgi:hypothetical protein